MTQTDTDTEGRVDSRGFMQWWVFYADGTEAGPYLFKCWAERAMRRGTRRKTSSNGSST